jgi:transcriptional regulator with XRE-family HTH domain
MNDLLEQPEFGRRLKALRLERGLAQTDIAGPGMSAGYLSRLESGMRPPTARTVAYLSEKLGVNASAFGETTGGDDLSRILATVTSGDDDATVEALENAVRTDELADPATRWQALWLIAKIQFQQGQRADELVTLRTLTRLSDQIDVAELRVRSRNLLARCQRSLGDVLAAQASAREAYELATTRNPHASDTARTLMILVSVESELGRLAEARAHADKLAQVLVNTPGTLRVEALWTVATVLTREGDHVGAAEMLTTALKEMDSRDDLTLWLRLRLAATSLYLQMTPPDTEQATQRLAEAEPALKLVGTPVLVDEFGFLQALLAYRMGDYVLAGARSDGLAETGENLSFRDRMRLDLLRNQIRIKRGERDEAIAAMREMAKKAQEATYVDLSAEIWRALADLL